MLLRTSDLIRKTDSRCTSRSAVHPGVGAAPIEVFDTLLNALGPGGKFALSLNDHALADPQFEAKLRARIDDGSARLLFQEYSTHLPGIDLKSNVYVLEKL